MSFHALEDRIVKRFSSRHAKAPAGNRRLPVVEEFVPALRAIGDARKADSTELAGNPRARSAVLRVAEKLGLGIGDRSEEHTSELQSLMRISYAVFCMKKKTKKQHKRL